MKIFICLFIVGVSTIATASAEGYDDYHSANEHPAEETAEPAETEAEEKPEFPYLSEILETAYFLTEVYLHTRTDAGIRRLESDLADANAKLDQILAGSGTAGKDIHAKTHHRHVVKRMAFVLFKFARLFLAHRSE